MIIEAHATQLRSRIDEGMLDMLTLDVRRFSWGSETYKLQ
jgi:hypothetical protein